MRRSLAVLAGATALAATSLADAAPIIRGGPIPDPAVVAKCRGVAGPQMVWVFGSIVPATFTAEPARAARETPPLGKEVYTVPGGYKARVQPSIFAGTGVFRPNSASDAARKDAAWCAGTYREDAGTNFAGS